MLSPLKLILFTSLIVAMNAVSAQSKLTGALGFFSINAKTSGESASISNPSAMNIGYLKPLSEQIEFRLNYSLLLADFTGSDIGYGVNVGLNYYPLTGGSDQRLSTNSLNILTYEPYRPYLGAVFAQRNFQSIRNSYAGFGFLAGIEKYHNEKMNLYAEISYLPLSGSGLSTATEIQALIGLVLKL